MINARMIKANNCIGVNCIKIKNLDIYSGQVNIRYITNTKSNRTHLLSENGVTAAGNFRHNQGNWEYLICNQIKITTKYLPSALNYQPTGIQKLIL